MTQISVCALKKQAKLLRKNNKNLKNHNQSLNQLSNQYGYDNWQALIDSCYLKTNQENQMENVNNVSNSANELLFPKVRTTNSNKVKTIEQLPIEISKMLEPLNDSFNDLRKEYLRFQKLKDRKDEHISAYIHDIVFDDYSGDNNLEKKKVSALIDYIVGSYFINRKNSIHKINLEQLFNIEQGFAFEARTNTFCNYSLTINMNEYLDILSPYKDSTMSLKRLFCESNDALDTHKSLFMHLKRAIKIFGIFHEIKELASNKHINNAIFEWLSDYNNTARLSAFRKEKLDNPISFYIKEVENYDSKYNKFMHEENISMLRNGNIKVIKLSMRHRLQYEEIVQFRKEIIRVKIETLADFVKHNVSFAREPNIYIRNIGENFQILDPDDEISKIYLRLASFDTRFVDFYSRDFMDTMSLNFYFLER